MGTNPSLKKVRLLFLFITISFVIGVAPMYFSFVSWNKEACNFNTMPKVTFFLGEVERCAAEKTATYGGGIVILLATLVVITTAMFLYNPNSDWHFAMPKGLIPSWKVRLPRFKKPVVRLGFRKINLNWRWPKRTVRVKAAPANTDTPTKPVFDPEVVMKKIGTLVARKLQQNGNVGVILVSIAGMDISVSRSFIAIDATHNVDSVRETIKTGFISVSSVELRGITVHSKGIADLQLLVTVNSAKSGGAVAAEYAINEICKGFDSNVVYSVETQVPNG